MNRNIGSKLFTVLLLISALAISGDMRPVRAASALDLVIEIQSEQPINMYAQPSFGAQVLRTIGKGNRATWNVTYQFAEGRNWMPIEIMGMAGWLAPNVSDVFFADPTRITPGIDRSAVIAPAANTMNLYETPGRGNRIIGQIPVGTQLKVIDGPVVTDLYTWWPVQVVGSTTSGWVVDTVYELSVITPLQVYGINVCDNFDLKRFGAVGWDSVRATFPAVIPADETIQCLASSNMLSNGSPVVVVSASNRNDNSFGRHHASLYIFEQRAGAWFTAYQTRTQDFNRTDRLSLHDLSGDGTPMLIWNERVDGTGSFLNINIFRYVNEQVTPVFTSKGHYKGNIQIPAPGVFTVVEAVLGPNDANCCPSAGHRMTYQWQGGRFIPVADTSFAMPGVPPGGN